MKQFSYPDWKPIKKILSVALVLLHFHPNIQVLEGVPVTRRHTRGQFIMQIRHVFYKDNVHMYMYILCVYIFKRVCVFYLHTKVFCVSIGLF